MSGTKKVGIGDRFDLPVCETDKYSDGGSLREDVNQTRRRQT